MSANVSTKLVHLVSSGPHQWWHHTPLCVFGGSCDLSELTNVRSLLPELAQTGFEALSVEPDSTVWSDSPIELQAFIDAVHRAGIKVIIRCAIDDSLLCGDGVEHSPTDIVDRLSHVVSCGADGVDIGLLDAPGPRRTALGEQRLSELISMLHTEIADRDAHAILIAETLSADVHDIDFHLQEHWFHHLRDGALLFSPWEASQIRQRVTTVLQHRDALGHIANWHWSFPADIHEEAARASFLPWCQEDTEERRSALAIFALALPGSVSVLFRHMGGRIVDSGTGRRRVWAADHQARHESVVMGTALRIRERRSMGTGSLAWVDNLPWAHEGISVHLCAGVTVVLNTSDQPVVVPPEHSLLLTSDRHAQLPANGTVVQPGVCAWFETARVRPPEVSFTD